MEQSTAAPGVDLESAFSAFNDLSRDLVSSYRDLEDRVSVLNRELAAARSERWNELLEKERLAQRFALLLEALPGGVVVLDGEGRVDECNPAAAGLLGGDVRGRRWRDVVAESFTPRPDDGHEVTLNDGRRVNISTCSLGDQPGQILLLKDVTETRKLQDQAARMERLSALGRTVASLAHQIRTPLAAALLYASGLDRGHVRDRVVARLRQLESLVEDMLGYARGQSFEVEPLCLVDLLGELAAGQAAAAPGAEIDLEAPDPAGPLWVAGNREALASALQNLVDNALDAAGPGVRVRLSARARSPESVAVEIADDGPGVPVHLVDRVFDPFFTTREAGTGLGLAAVRSIVHAHRGQVGLEPGRDGGTTVAITLPRVAAPTREEER